MFFVIISINLDTLKRHDNYLFKLINQGYTNSVLDAFFSVITCFGGFKYILIGCTIIGIAPTSQKTKQTILLIFFSLSISSLISTTLKNHYRVERPFEILENYRLVSDHTSTSYSYPSGHTTIVFSYISVIAIRHPKSREVSVSIAFLVGLSRIYLGVHWISDVIGGALLGSCIGSLVIVLDTLIYNNRGYTK